MPENRWSVSALPKWNSPTTTSPLTRCRSLISNYLGITRRFGFRFRSLPRRVIATHKKTILLGRVAHLSLGAGYGTGYGTATTHRGWSRQGFHEPRGLEYGPMADSVCRGGRCWPTPCHELQGQPPENASSPTDASGRTALVEGLGGNGYVQRSLGVRVWVVTPGEDDFGRQFRRQALGDFSRSRVASCFQVVAR